MTQPIPCPACAVPIPAVVAAAPFCPYCGARKPAVAQIAAAVQIAAGVQLGGAAHIAVRAGAAEKKDERVFSSSLGGAMISFDPRVGYALIAAHQPEDGQARLRVYDLHNKRVAWEALAGQLADDDLDYEGLRVHAGNVYVSWERNLRALDLLSGKPKWGSELSDALEYDSSPFASRGVRVIDSSSPAAPGARGVVWAIAVDNFIYAFDRETGQPLWREEREHMPRRIWPFDAGLFLLEVSSEVQLVDPARKTVIDSISGRIERIEVEGRYGLLQVRRWGWRERDGLLLHDFATKKEVLFEAVENVESDVPSVMGHGRLFCAVESGAKLFAGPHGRSVELVPGFHIRALAMCGPTLMALLVKHHGTRVRRVVGVDPQTLTVRFDLGEMTTKPSDHSTHQMCTNGIVTVLVTSPKDDGDTCELWAVNAGGQVIWRVPVDDWRAHYFLGGNVVVSSGSGWQILRPDNGQVIAALRGARW